MVAPLIPLREICGQDRQSIRSGERGELSYIGMESIESNTGALHEGDHAKTPEAPQANSFYFDQAHVLYGKLRPYLNKVFVPDFAGKCSTEFIPLRPHPRLHREYLAYYLRSKHVVALITAKTSGARMPRADMDFVLSLPIPLPDMREQVRIVDLLSRAEGINRLRREAQRKAAEVIPALFIDMFGDPATNPRSWPVVKFATFGNCRLGKMLDKGQQTGENPKTYLRNVNVQWDRIDTYDLLTMDFDPSAQDTFRLVSGDVLICEGGEIGRAAVWYEQIKECFYQKALHRLRPDLAVARPDFVVWLLWHLARSGALAKSSTHATIAHLTGVTLSSLPVICPPIRLQSEFEKRIELCHGIQLQQGAAATKAKETFDALIARAFPVINGASNG